MIYHMLPADAWQQQAPDQPYHTETLQTEGFIHCTGEPELLARVANNFYRAEVGKFVILCLDEPRITSEVLWEQVGFHRFPHIYGPLNLDAIVAVVEFPREVDGRFVLPTNLPESAPDLDIMDQIHTLFTH